MGNKNGREHPFWIWEGTPLAIVSSEEEEVHQKTGKSLKKINTRVVKETKNKQDTKELIHSGRLTIYPFLWSKIFSSLNSEILLNFFFCKTFQQNCIFPFS